MWWFSEPEFLETVLPGRGVCHAARIGDRFDLPALDESRPKRDGNEPCAHQCRSGEDYNPRRDRDGLLPSIGVSPWTESGPRHCHSSRISWLKQICRSKWRIPLGGEGAARSVAG